MWLPCSRIRFRGLSWSIQLLLSHYQCYYDKDPAVVMFVCVYSWQGMKDLGLIMNNHKCVGISSTSFNGLFSPSSATSRCSHVIFSQSLEWHVWSMNYVKDLLPRLVKPPVLQQRFLVDQDFFCWSWRLRAIPFCKSSLPSSVERSIVLLSPVWDFTPSV